ncbi:uncharacterized protein LOC126455961 [Schistocerca serialis cubense]|uniref:uncharacterized protein LOC126455961 n=1 Tax=Schistocerca serialis cubense TaxID=2023355 RepID=UPI00214E2648|nr:uncharacterized protein LOC126455961 [Schistocerca serialis cubense]
MDVCVRLSILQIFSSKCEAGRERVDKNVLCGLTLEEILAELENHQESDDEDVELAIIPPDADVITDEEDIGENVLNNESVVQDVASTLELITSRDEANATVVPPEAKRMKWSRKCGYHKLRHENVYWEQAPDVGVPLVFNSMSRNRFREIKRFIHLKDNSKICKNDKMYKLRLYFEMMKGIW